MVLCTEIASFSIVEMGGCEKNSLLGKLGEIICMGL